jgi:putative flippase GtrA
MEVYYVTAAAISAAVGAIISFYLGRTWAFRRRDGSLSAQAVKYLLTSGVSLFLNTAGIYLFTDYANIPYGFSKVIISILIGIFFNFLMYRYFVYR